MSDMTVFEFDVDVTVRKRLRVDGPRSREQARTLLKTAIQGGLGFITFAKYGADGRPVEEILSSDFELVDPKD